MTNKTEAAAYLAQSAYLDAEALKSLDGYKGKLIDRNGAQVLVAKSKKELWFAFRGTEPTKLNDIAADLKVTRNSALAGGKVHSGFQDELDELWADCLKEIEANSKLKTPRTIYLTGHSLGAAMATIAATRIEAECLFTFGSPRVGGKRFVQELKCPHQRFVNNNDIVTKVPPQDTRLCCIAATSVTSMLMVVSATLHTGRDGKTSSVVRGLDGSKVSSLMRLLIMACRTMLFCLLKPR